MKGIYKITSPSGKVYIGQSTDIKRRFFNYRKVDSCKRQRALHNSFLKYGFEAHTLEIVYELPPDITAEDLSNYEQFFMDQHREAGYALLNIKQAGPHGGHSEETKRRLSAAHIGRPKSREAVMKQAAAMKGKPSPRKGTTHTDEARRKIREKRALQKNVSGAPKGAIPWNKGLKNVCSAWNKGLSGIFSEETIRSISQSLKGRKLSPESIRKREETRKANGNNKGWCEEARKRRSELYKGRVLPDEQKKKIALGLRMHYDAKREKSNEFRSQNIV